MEFLTETLPNGLEIVAECNAEAHSTALGFFVRTGSRDETDEVAGVSHFLEHMMFKGTPTRSADDVNREFDEMGAHYNAFTSEENTVYYAAVLPEYQDQAVSLLGDILRPSLRQDDFDTEKQVILEEIRMYEDQPPFGADDKAKAAHYGRHPLGRSVLGTHQSVTDLSVDQMRAYFQRRYGPRNIMLIAAGRIDFAALVAEARRVCGHWEPGESGRDLPEPPSHDGFHVLCKETAAQQYSLQLCRGPSATDADRYAAKLLTMILGDDSGSRLYWELVDPGLAEQASVSHYEYDAAGLFMTYLTCEPQDTAENLQRVLNVYRQAAEQGFDDDELKQAKSKVMSRIVLASERPRGRLFAVGSDWVQRRQYRSMSDEMDVVTGLRVDDLVAVQAKYPLTRCTTVSIGPLADLQEPK